ncbi:YciK family oxidoreductase [Acinetobacter faecalis]|uniref:YciK family oxidoreductase n=1 Tax=Acinetobacter faecalis TaxID=2665161 RepID=A0A6L6GG14_9GAMM|nr:YciK family oxidoreductase [Acinetobacter faecalis]MDY6459620.1 YciK family oxidoreductase [Acinetobacter faecalis]MDY6462572.1 YciK family oxidoreductase [Acinetobacter faecalis]MDY6510075.1 YciK family oxidoreductase [Acinetobacter faecalis]MDY6524547.1 YciK family oxidoreductase [Acinetobacter faecalis]MTD11510.1 YciK family oxidoreductase [Acinetobacter faecalis]
MKYSEYKPRPDLLKDRIILVTGAGDGIGRAAALSYALHGATVVLHGRTLNKLEVIYDEIESLGAPQPAILPLQLSSASSRDYELLVDTLEKQFGRLDGILHNAGILGERTELENYPVDVWDDVMAVNLRAPFVLTQELLPLLKKSESASVVFASSGVGRETRERWGAYSVSKIAIEAVSELFAKENTHQNLRFNCINPGATRTAMRAKAFPDEDPKTLATPEMIMPAYLYLMGDDSLALNGQSIDAQD